MYNISISTAGYFPLLISLPGAELGMRAGDGSLLPKQAANTPDFPTALLWENKICCSLFTAWAPANHPFQSHSRESESLSAAVGLKHICKLFYKEPFLQRWDRFASHGWPNIAALLPTSTGIWCFLCFPFQKVPFEGWTFPEGWKWCSHHPSTRTGFISVIFQQKEGAEKCWKLRAGKVEKS